MIISLRMSQYGYKAVDDPIVILEGDGSPADVALAYEIAVEETGVRVDGDQPWTQERIAALESLGWTPPLGSNLRKEYGPKTIMAIYYVNPVDIASMFCFLVNKVNPEIGLHEADVIPFQIYQDPKRNLLFRGGYFSKELKGESKMESEST